MRSVSNASAGLLMYRLTAAGIEVLLAHPGGPVWANRDEGAWTVPKGKLDGQEPLEAARREFEEETGIVPEGPFQDLGEIVQKAGKRVQVWACQGDGDPAQMRSNTIQVEWPPRSGRRMEIPEVDRCEWFDPAEAKRKLNPAQAEFVDRLMDVLAPRGPAT